MTLRLAIVGVGNNARQSYLPYLSKREDIELLYHDCLPERAEEAAKMFGGTAVPDPGDLGARTPDAALVLTREMDRYEAGIQLVDQKIPRLFFEKPLVARNGQAQVDEEDFVLGRDLLQRAAGRGCETAMIFNYRFLEQTLRAVRLREERKLGALIQVSGWVNYACWSHCIDLISHFGGEFETLAASGGGKIREGAGNKSEDVAVSFQLTGGGAGALVGTACEHILHPFFHLMLCFEEGRIAFTGLDGDMELMDYRHAVHERFAVSRQWSRWELYGQSFEKSLAAYLESIVSKTPPPVPGMAGLRELQFEAALRKAVRTGKTVPLETDFPLTMEKE